MKINYPLRLLIALIAFFAFASAADAQNVSVISSGGSLTSASYTTLKGAFDKIDSGYHTGVISITISGNVAETAPAVLVASGVSYGLYTSSYSSVTISPVGGPWTVTGAGTAFNSKGLITLDGADNVTIDGGSSRNLIFNVAGATVPAVIWLKSGGAVGLGCANDTIRNCQVYTGVLNSESYGIIVSGYNTTNPVPTYSLAAYDCDNVLIKNNKVYNCYYGISVSGNNTALSDNFRIDSNDIGSDVASASIGKYGIYVNNMDSITISKNKINNVTCVGNAYGIYLYNSKSLKILKNTISNISSSVAASSAPFGPFGIYLYNSVNTATIKSYFDGNTISNVKYTGSEAKNVDAYGIYATKAPYLEIRNNSIAGILGSGYGATSISGAVSGSTYGIFVDDATSLNLNIYYNSINLFGTYPKATASASYYAFSAAIAINNSSITPINIYNNVISDSIVANAASTGFTTCYAIYTASTLTFNGTTNKINYNDYYITGTGAKMAYYNATTYATYASWLAVVTTDANSIALFPSFNTATNLAPLPGSSLISMGTPIVGITTDLVGITSRSTTAPTIGAFETALDAIPPTIAFTKLTTTILTGNRTLSAVITDNLRGVDTLTVSPRLYYKKTTASNDSASWKYVTVTGNMSSATFTIDASKLSGVSVGDTIQYFIIAKDLEPAQANISLSSGTLNAAQTSIDLKASAFPIGGTIDAYAVVEGLHGVFTVGTGGNYTSLTGTNGAFNAINTAAFVTGDVTLKIISDIDESGVVGLKAYNAFTGKEKISIVPDGTTLRTISGAMDSLALIRLINTRNITIDGSFNGSGRYLKIAKTSLPNDGVWVRGTAIQLVNANGTTAQGCRNITIANTIIFGSRYGYGTTAAERFAIYAGDKTLSTDASATMSDHDSITIVNNVIYHGYFLIYSTGGANASNDNWTVRGNLFAAANAATSSETNTSQGLHIYKSNYSSITDNLISGIDSKDSVSGICLAYVYNSKVDNNTLNTMASVLGSTIGIYCYYGADDTLSHNTVMNFTTSVKHLYGIFNAYSLRNIISDNTIKNFTSTYSSGYVFGIYNIGYSKLTINNNLVTNLTGAATSTTYPLGGIFNTGYFSSTYAGDSLLLSNNSISALTSNSNLYGLYISAGKGHNLFHNAVHLSGTNSSANLSSALFLTYSSSNTTLIDSMYNNNFSNLIQSTNASPGNCYSIYVDDASATNVAFNSALPGGSNYNNLYSYGNSYNYLAYWGGNTVADIATWKTTTGQDYNSLNINPLFSSKTILVPMRVSQLYISKGVPTSVKTDILGTARSSTPTIGTYEQYSDIVGPSITYTPLTNTTLITSPSIDVVITDESGVNNVGVLAPRLYFKTSTMSNDSAGWKNYVNGTLTGTNTYTFTIDYTKIGSPKGGVIIQYFIVAEDISPLSNVGFGGSSAPFAIQSSVVLQASAFPVYNFESYQVYPTLSGTWTIGAGGDFPSLTGEGGLFSWLNNPNTAVTGDLTAKVISDVNEPATYDLNTIYRTGGDWKINIVPDGTTVRTLKGPGKNASGGIFRFTSVRNIIIDGSYNGSGRYLTFTDSVGTSLSYVVPIIQIAGPVGAGCSNITLQNCNVKGSYNGSGTNSYCVYIGNSASIGANSANGDNDTIHIINNVLTRAHYGIVSNGTDGSYNNDSVLIQNNIIGSKIASEYVTINGMYLSGLPYGIVSGNEVMNVINASNGGQAGININAYCGNILVEKNIIHGISYSGSSSGGRGEGLIIGSTSCDNINIFNNIIYDINGVGYSSYPDGIRINGNNIGLKIYHNSVNLAGAYVASSYTSPINSMALYISATSSLDVQNNIFANTLSSSTATSGNSYSVYVASTAFDFTNSIFDYNDYYSNPTNSKLVSLAYGNGANVTTLGDWNQLTNATVNSVSVDPAFNSSSVLNLSFQSPLITTNRGYYLNDVPNDALGVIRSNPPTIGAFENGADIVSPTITFTKLSNFNKVASVSLSANINDNNTGLDTASTSRPTLYYKKTSQANDVNSWKAIQAVGTVPNFTFTLDSARISGFNVGDTIQYFIVARDKNIVPNYAISSGINSGTLLSTALASSNFPITGTIDNFRILSEFSGVKTVGTGGNFTSLTGSAGAFNALNNSVITGDVTLKVISDLSEDGTVELDYLSKLNNYPYAIKIIPDTNTLRTISGTYNGALIRMQAIKGLTFDGSNSAGSGKYFKFINSPSSTTAAASTFALFAGANAGCKNIAIKNSIVVGPTNTNSTTYAIFAGTSAFGTLYGNTDSVNIENCWIYRGNNLIYNAGTSKQYNNYWTIKGNKLGASATKSENNTLYGIYLSYNQNETISGDTLRDFFVATASASSMYGLYENYCNNGNINNNVFTSFKDSAATTSTYLSYYMYGAYFNYCNNATVNNNTLSSFSVVGTLTEYQYLYGIYFNYGGNENCYNNNLSNFSATAINSSSYGYIYGIGFYYCNNSNIYNNVLTSFSAIRYYIYGVYIYYSNYDTLSNNIISNLTSTNCYYVYGAYCYGSYNVINKNKISGLTTNYYYLYGIYLASSSYANVSQNTVKSLTNTYSSGYVYGIYSSSGTLNHITDNLLNGFTTTGSSSNIYGVYLSYGYGGWIERNVLKTLSSGASLYGIYYYYSYNSSNDSMKINNNSISSITSATKLYGVYAYYGKIKEFMYNSIELAGTRNVKYDSYALFTQTCLIDSMFENSISNIINNSYTTSYYNYCIYNSTPSVYAVSDYNNLYAGDPTLLVNNYVGYYSSKYQSLNDWRVGTSLDVSSISADPLFAPGTYLMPLAISPLYTSGSTTPISVVVDILGNTRTHNAIGCYDVIADLNGPVITFTSFALSKVESSKTLAVNIVDAMNGVDSANYRPRLYYKKSTANNDSASWQYNVATGSAPNFSFVFDYSKIGGVKVGDEIQFFIVAQDNCNAPKPNVGVNNGSSMFDFTNVKLSSIMFPVTGYNTFNIAQSLNGVKTVGTVAFATTDYPSLTGTNGAFATINNSIVVGDLTLKVVSDLSETSTNALSLITREGGDWKINIVPDTNILRTIKGPGKNSDASGVYRFLGVRNVNVDGSFNGSGRYLLFTDSLTSVSYITPIIQISGAGAGSGCTNINVQNSLIKGQCNTGSYNSYNVYIGNTSIGSGNVGDNDSISIINNVMTRSHYGVFLGGTSGANNDNLVIKNNIIGSENSDEYVTINGMYMHGCANSLISGNEIMNIIHPSNGGQCGINMEHYCDSSIVENNIIHGISYSGSGSGAGQGIYINGTNHCNYISVINNVIYDINGTGYGQYPNGLSITNTNYGHKIYYNSVNLYGSYVASSYTTPMCSRSFYLGANVDTIDARNNVFINTLDNPSIASATGNGSYAIWVNSTSFPFANCHFDYNDYFSNPLTTSLAKMGYFGGTDVLYLTDWSNSVSYQDANSKSADPAFYTNTLLIPTPSSYLLQSGDATVPVLTDIIGELRTLTPTIGAYEQTFTTALPSVETDTLIANLLQNSATTSGTIVNKGGSAIQSRGMVIDIASYPTITNNLAMVDNGAGLGVIIANWTGLQAQRDYYVRAFATNLSGTSYGSNISFSTLPNYYAPAIATYNASSITKNSATLSGAVTSDFYSPIVERGFVWNTDPQITLTNFLGKSDVAATSGSYVTTYSYDLKGLTPATTYYFRGFATNGIGTSYGSVLTFTTLVEGYTVAGTVSYPKYKEDVTNTKILLIDTAFKAMPKAPWVKLINASGNTVDSTTADAVTGSFSFSRVPNGTYRLALDSNMTWTSSKGYQLTLVDYKYIKEYVVSLVNFDSLQMRVANIDRSGTGVNKASITLTDAAYLMQRIVGLANSTTWKSCNYMYALETSSANSSSHTSAILNLDMTITVGGGDKTGIKVRGLSSGDVNGQ